MNVRLITFTGTSKPDGEEKQAPRPGLLKPGNTLKPSVPSLKIPALETGPAEDAFVKREVPSDADDICFVLTPAGDEEQERTLSRDNDEYLRTGKNWNALEAEAVQQEEDRVAQQKNTGKLMSPKDDKSDEENLGKMSVPGK